MPRSQQSRFERESSKLRALATAGAYVWFTKHAEAEMKKDGIEKIDVINMLSRCVVTLTEVSGGEDTWRAEGRDVDLRTIVAVVVCYDDQHEIKVITGWARKKP